MRLTFRPAKPASSWWNLLKTLLQTVVFWTTFLAVLPGLIFAVERSLDIPRFAFPNQSAVAWLAFALASSLGLWSGVTMALVGRGTPLPTDAARELVVTGPYKYVRNPMAAAGLLQGACVGAWLGSWGTIGYVMMGFVVWNWLVRPVEEANLLERFGENFDRYRRSVRCWIPTFPGYDGQRLD